MESRQEAGGMGRIAEGSISMWGKGKRPPLLNPTPCVGSKAYIWSIQLCSIFSISWNTDKMLKLSMDTISFGSNDKAHHATDQGSHNKWSQNFHGTPANFGAHWLKITAIICASNIVGRLEKPHWADWDFIQGKNMNVPLLQAGLGSRSRNKRFLQE